MDIRRPLWGCHKANAGGLAAGPRLHHSCPGGRVMRQAEIVHAWFYRDWRLEIAGAGEMASGLREQR
jgi:hypothetical protein